MSYRFDSAEGLQCKDCIYRKYDGTFSWGEPFEGYKFSTCTQYIRKPSDVWEWAQKCYLYKKQQPGEPLIWLDGSKGKVYYTELYDEDIRSRMEQK